MINFSPRILTHEWQIVHQRIQKLKNFECIDVGKASERILIFPISIYAEQKLRI